ncbi:MAG: actP 2 [Hydrocarboniphaga sp.]|uniref:heavy metal translocating P-type ATPase n=1 Tax=Hydrocarboniphaga sp. TaxID=2033016 RepID=UPI00260B4FD7|nr:heavy metal translocating P-type ATPase [Hydrocarboniphaga sp.]MDB5971357.1 actP 2 [Hydrocarboniphaga sp.]
MSAAWAAYDAPLLQDSVSHRLDGQRREMLLRVHGMHCASCVRALERALSPLCSGVRVSLATNTVELIWEDAQAKPSILLAAIDSAGFRPEPIDDRPDLRAEQRERRALLLRIGSSGVLGMQVMMLAATRYTEHQAIDPVIELIMRYAQWAMATPVLLYSGWPFLRGAWLSLRDLRIGMDVPISLALLLAYLASCSNVLLRQGHVYFDSVTMFVFLLLLARWFEGRGRAEASRRLRELAAAQPLTALRESGSGIEEVASLALRTGDVLVVPPAAAIAADGLLLSDWAELDESLLTGEAAAVVRAAEHAVFAGTVNLGTAPLRVQVTATGFGTQLSYINHMVHHAQSRRPRIELLADRVAGWISLLVLLAASFGALAWWPQSPQTAFEVALAVLVITCPCALSLATPAALAAASSALASRGVLLTRVDTLLELPRIDTVCFDKTGTLTTGAMRCVQVLPQAGFDAAHCLDLAAALEHGIQHPIASAFHTRQPLLHAEQIEARPGHGVRGRIDGHEYQLAGSSGEGALTWLSLQRQEQEIARFGLAYELRPDAAATVAALRAENLRLIMLSGDGTSAVAAVADALGITEYRSRQSPADKLQLIQQLQAEGSRVWMVGDGVNDAPTLAAADVSTSLVSGSALAQTQAALLLTGKGLGGLHAALLLARRTRRVIRQNLAWAACYNLAAIPLALTGNVTPWIAALGMGASSVAVVSNALRLSRVDAGAVSKPVSKPAANNLPAVIAS